MTTTDITRRSFLTGAASVIVLAALAPMSPSGQTPAFQAVELDTAYARAKKKAVVICFSCTGTTWGFAKRIKKATGAKLVRVKAKDAYSQDDIEWADGTSRVAKEHKSASSPAKSDVRPAIANLAAIKKAVKKADVVYIGYPIWWGEAPHIMYTLIESVSLKGKTIVPFCTSGSSGLGDSAKHLKANAKKSRRGTWKMGKNYYDIPSQKSVTKWLKKASLV